MLPDYITNGPLYVLAATVVLVRRIARRIRRYAIIAWNAAIEAFWIWPLDQAIKFCIWHIARRDGMSPAEKKAFAEETWAEARSNDPAWFVELRRNS